MYFILLFVAAKTKKWATDKSMQISDWTVFCEGPSSCSLIPAEFADHIPLISKIFTNSPAVSTLSFREIPIIDGSVVLFQRQYQCIFICLVHLPSERWQRVKTHVVAESRLCIAGEYGAMWWWRKITGEGSESRRLWCMKEDLQTCVFVGSRPYWSYCYDV